MTTKLPIRLVKKALRNPTQPDAAAAPDNNTAWSTTVRSWIHQLREKPLGEALPAFERLFKRALSEPPAPADPTPPGQPANGGEV